MDHAKTASPVFSHKSKELDGLMKLPVFLTGMIAHSHADVHYAHYGLDLFAHDSNYTVGRFNGKVVAGFGFGTKVFFAGVVQEFKVHQFV